MRDVGYGKTIGRICVSAHTCAPVLVFRLEDVTLIWNFLRPYMPDDYGGSESMHRGDEDARDDSYGALITREDARVIGIH